MPPELRNRFVALSPVAIDALEKIVRNEKEKGGDRLRAAEIILDRAWGKAPAAPEDLDAVESSARPLAGLTAEALVGLLKR